MATKTLRNVSKTRVNWGGDLLRDYLLGGPQPTGHDFVEAMGAITDYRALHAAPLQRVAVGLRYYVSKHTEMRPIIVGQRLKRLRTIVDKLCRHPGMNLARMHDIGGCRAVVTDETEVRAIATDLHRQRRWEIRREYDYISEPKPDGYRAVHLVLMKDDRLIEVQLRTIMQHAWAELIELTDRRNPEIELKGGRAPADLVEYYRLGSVLLAARERGEPVDISVVEQFRSLHRKVAGYVTPKDTP